MSVDHRRRQARHSTGEQRRREQVISQGDAMTRGDSEDLMFTVAVEGYPLDDVLCASLGEVELQSSTAMLDDQLSALMRHR